MNARAQEIETLRELSRKFQKIEPLVEAQSIQFNLMKQQFHSAEELNLRLIAFKAELAEIRKLIADKGELERRLKKIEDQLETIEYDIYEEKKTQEEMKIPKTDFETLSDIFKNNPPVK